MLTQAGRRAGLFDTQLQSALDALVGSYLLVGYVWWSAASVHRIDVERHRSAEALREALGTLERRVAERTAELSESNVALQAEVAERKRAEAELLHQTHLIDLAHDAIFIRASLRIFSQICADRFSAAKSPKYRVCVYKLM